MTGAGIIRRGSGLLLLGALLAGCAAMAEVPGAVQGRWLAEDIGGRGVTDRLQSVIEIGADGSIGGSTGCNRLGGQARITDRGDAGTLRVGPLIVTEMGCAPAIMDQEARFLAALSDTEGWQHDAERRKLILIDASGRMLMVLTAMQP